MGWNLRGLLNLRNITISRVNESTDGMGGIITTTTTATLSYAAIWQSGSSYPFLSDRLCKESTHILAFEPTEFSFSTKDATLTSEGRTYTIIGEPDDIMHKGIIAVLPLKVVS